MDTTLFFGIAFVGAGLPWMQWATGDLAVEWTVAAISILVYRAHGVRFSASLDNGQPAER